MAPLPVVYPRAARPTPDARGPPLAFPAPKYVTAPHPATSATTPARRVLLVDDEAAIRNALHRFFARRGWHVDEAADGERALACLLAGDDPVPYDAVISDFRMPRLTGEQLHDALARERPALLERCVFSTGDVTAPDAARFRARTCCRVLEKPFELGQLAAMVEAFPPRRAQ